MKNQRSYCAGCCTIQDLFHTECLTCGETLNEIIIEVQQGSHRLSKECKLIQSEPLRAS
ncbi:hypothetical protein WD019_09500 [Fictibacillus sp. Mic-4]|uniref:hypothetical protein n=1 Tax=Fictibacillus TaxID=1329200 RepID=UPI0004274244|nr:hypothetical protein [Fictibacillus gelatini]